MYVTQWYKNVMNTGDVENVNYTINIEKTGVKCVEGNRCINIYNAMLQI